MFTVSGSQAIVFNVSTLQQWFPCGPLLAGHLTRSFAKSFPSAFTTIAFGYSRRRWFETCSCKPVPRGLPSSVKQLITTQHFSFRARGTR